MASPTACRGCGAAHAGRQLAEEQLAELRTALAEIGLTWLVSPDPAHPGRLIPTTEAAHFADETLIESFRARLGLPRTRTPLGPCGRCGRPYDPDHLPLVTGRPAGHGFKPYPDPEQ